MKKNSFFLLLLVTISTIVVSCQPAQNQQRNCGPGYTWNPNILDSYGNWGACVQNNASITGNPGTPPAGFPQYAISTYGIPKSLGNGSEAFLYGGNVTSALGGYVYGFSIPIWVYNPLTGRSEQQNAFVEKGAWGSIQMSGGIDMLINAWSNNNVLRGTTLTGISVNYFPLPIGQEAATGAVLHFTISGTQLVPAQLQ